MIARLLRIPLAVIIAASAVLMLNPTIAEASLPTPFDTTFGTDGIAIPEIPLQRSQSQASNIIRDQSDNLYVLLEAEAGSAGNETRIAKFSSNGVSVSGYGTNGRSQSVNLFGPDLAFQSDGQIIVSGFQFINNQRFLTVYRFTTSGQLDTTFGLNGAYSLQTFPGKEAWGSLFLAVNQSSDRIHIGFDVNNLEGNNQNFYFIALNADGELDYDWSNGGAQEVVPRGGPVSAYSSLTDMQILSDGSLLGIGSAIASSGIRALVLTKLNQNGYLDTTFDGATSGNGVVFIQFASESDAFLSASVVLQDDSLVIAGVAGTYYYGPWFYGATKVLADGTVDTSFGTNGFTLSTLQANFQSLPSRTIGIQPDGRYVFNISSGTTAGFMRLQTNGTLSNSPNCSQCLWSGADDGVMSTSLVVQTTGSVVVAGLHRTDNNAIVRRFVTAGTADATFTDANIQINSKKYNTSLIKLRPQSDGSIYALGEARADGSNYSPGQVVVFKLTAQATLESQFGQGGFKFLAAPSDTFWTSALDIQILSDEKILVLGGGGDNQNNIAQSVLLWRLNANGSIDNSFGSNGFSITSEAGAELYPTSLIPTPDGKVLIPLSRSVNWVGSPWIYRYTATGVLDPSFTDSQNFAGGVKPTIGDNTGYISVVQPTQNGKFFVAGSTNINSQTHSYLARFLSNGTLDTTFAGGYLAEESSAANSLNYISNVYTDINGDIYVLGATTAPTESGLLMKLNSDGTLNSSFNGTGRLLISYRDPAQVDYSGLQALIIKNGVITVIGGGDSNPQQYRSRSFSGLARVSTSGVLDTNFGSNGIVDPFGTQESYLSDIATSADGQGVILGSIKQGSQYKSLIMKIEFTSSPTTTVPTMTTPPTTTPATTQPLAPTTTTTIPPPVTASSDDIKLVISVSQAAVLKRMKLSVPSGSKVSMTSQSTKVCKVVKKKIIASSTGTCRISVTITDKKKKKTIKSTSFKVA